MILFNGHYCSVCRGFCGFEGGFMRGGFSGPFSHWICLDCDDWLDEIERPKKSEEIKMKILDEIMGVDEASDLWDLSPGYIKNLCAEERVQAKKVGNTWIIVKNQENPKQKISPGSRK